MPHTHACKHKHTHTTTVLSLSQAWPRLQSKGWAWMLVSQPAFFPQYHLTNTNRRQFSIWQPFIGTLCQSWKLKSTMAQPSTKITWCWRRSLMEPNVTTMKFRIFTWPDGSAGLYGTTVVSYKPKPFSRAGVLCGPQTIATVGWMASAVDVK